MIDLPNGTVTLFFTDVEGSTELLRRLGERYGTALEDQRRILRNAVAEHGGTEIDSRGDELFAAFPRASAAVAAAVAAQNALAEHQWPDGSTLKVRMGLHTGEPAPSDDGYLGLDVHRAARISAAAHGQQVLVSHTTRDLIGEGGEFVDLGEHQLKDLPTPERLFQVVVPGLATDFPPLRTADTDLSAGRERELAAALARPQRLLQRLRTSKHGFADLGWDARALLPAAPAETRDSLSRLARELFDAARTAAEADQAIAVVQRKELVRRLTNQREQAVLSKASEREAHASETQLTALDTLIARRAEAEEVAKVVRERLGEPRPKRLDESIEDVRRASRHLNAALDDAQRKLKVVGERLRRTRSRGVFRAGEQFVVPYVNEVGIDERRRFDSFDEAVRFRRGLRIARRSEAMFGADDSVGRETTHMSGYVGHWEVGEHQGKRPR
jgi:class 3 adenylate cyclase